MQEDDKKERLKSLRNEQSYLYDLFTRAAHSRSGTILKRLCDVDDEIYRLKKDIAKQRGE